MLDRNVLKVIQEDLNVYCHFSDCDGCKLKSGTYEEIIKHQVNCRACPDCKYLCWQDEYDCDCSKDNPKYFTLEEMEQHMIELKEKKEEEERREKEV